MTVELRLGRWQDALAGVDGVDLLLCDCPYAEKTHVGHDYAARAARFATVAEAGYATADRKTLGYTGWSDADVYAFVDHWSPRTKGWFVTITDHVLARSWERHLEAAGRYVFAPIPWVAPGSRVRLAGDGPSSWTCWIIVARPRGKPYSNWGTLPGAYVINQERGTGSPITGTKPLALMQALVRDYSRPGDLICDPCSGTGTTLLAARSLGRRAVGSEMDPKTHAYAKARLERGWQPELFNG